MTIYWKARGVKSASRTPYPREDDVLSFGTGSPRLPGMQ